MTSPTTPLDPSLGAPLTDDLSAPPRRLGPRFPELDTQPFWEATRDHELRYQTCDRCSTVIFYARRHCTACTSTSLSWQTSGGTGTIYTYSVIRRSQHPAFAHLVPYVIAWVDVDEGFRILTHITNARIDDHEVHVPIGAKVEVDWIDLDEVSLPGFRII